MKITINIDISGEEIGKILKGALMGAKKEVAKRSKTKTPAKFRKINRKVRYGGKNLDIDEEFAAQQKIAAEVDKTHPSLLKGELPKKRGRGRPRLTPEQKLERRKARLAVKKSNVKVVKEKPSKVVKRRWTTQEKAWLQTVAMKGKKKDSISKSMVKKFEKQFGYERSLKSLEMKARDLLGKRDKYKDKKYGKRK
jgi:hypothetical protein